MSKMASGRRVWFLGFWVFGFLAVCGGAEAMRKQVLKVDGEEVTIIRDEFGVPHVFAKSLRGVFFGNGYAIAQDRLWQMEKYRRQAKGELAEIFGEDALGGDREQRRLGYSEEERQKQFEALSTELKTILQSYADGVNAYIEEAVRQNKLPSDFQKLGITPRPWTPTDSIAIGQMMARRFGSSGGEELTILRVLQFLKLKFGDDAINVLNDLHWKNDPDAPTTIPSARDTGQRTRDKGHESRITNHEFALWLAEHASPKTLDEAIAFNDERESKQLAEQLDLMTKFGSYAWVIAPKKSKTKNAFLVGGPQMGFGTPSIAHEVHLSGVGLNSIGMGFAGIPGVLIGHNNYLAWTTTSGIADFVDIFAEKIDPKNRTRYLYKGEWRDMEKRTEVIKVKGREPESVEVYRTVHGTVLSFDEQAGVAYVRAESYRGKELGALEAIWQFNRARNIKEFAKGCPLIATSHNFFCATVKGDIGFWFCGHSPIRAEGIDYRFPVPGTGEADWKGILPFEKMPQIINPKQGFLCNWNNKPVDWWENGDLPVWGAIWHVKRICDLIEAKPKLTFEDMREICIDIGLYDINADYFKPLLLNASNIGGARGVGHERRTPNPEDKRLQEALRILEGWDNKRSDGSVAKTIFDAYLRALQEEIFRDEFSFVPESIFRLGIQASLIWHVLSPNAKVKKSRDYLNGKDRGEVMLTALRKAIEQLTKERGEDMSKWGYQLGQHDFSPLPGIPKFDRGTYIFIAELSKKGIRSISILPPGQSEDENSPHYKDQLELAAKWEFKPMKYLRQQLER